MMMDVKRIFVDTNVLVYSTNVLSPLKDIAKRAIQKAREQGIELIISQQILREYLAVTTRFSVTGSGVTLHEIVDNLQIFRTEFTLLEEKLAVLAKLIELIQIFPTAGSQVHDANIIATMLVHGIDYLLTHNVDDFKRFSEKIHILPLEEWAKSEEYDTEPEDTKNEEQ
jgi:predicted nucleic acid-binding protein